ncbi:MAG: aminoglycoside phosphotransferase family protein [Chloroflexales bacterium]|nr:aminoglycoside phosphotransferase family protein [Chloroflexales bacterium]
MEKQTQSLSVFWCKSRTMPEREEPLAGGNLTPVVRIGETVRRTQGFWSDAVHDLLSHLDRVGFAAAPRFLGVDKQGREMLSYLPGTVGFSPAVWLDESLVAAARLLRAYHDATLSYQAPADARQQMVYPEPSQHEVICHNDFAPYNLVFAAGLPTGIIDFDLAGPGPRVWDIAYAVYWFAPLYPHDLAHARGLDDLAQTSWRVRLFCNAYGWSDSSLLLDTVEARLVEMCQRLNTGAAQGDTVFLRMVAEGRLAGYERALATFRQRRQALAQQLATW